MPKGKPISVDLRWAIVRMHGAGVSIKTIAAYTDTSPRQIYRIVNRFLTTGKVLTATQRRTGRTRHLTSSDVAVGGDNDIRILVTHYPLQFLQGSLDHSCDKYLDELQLGLQETCGRVVSQSTIWRALRRSGYRMKKVRGLELYLFHC
jgi:transposase